MKRQGFTLIEILLVIVIMGLLGAIAQGRFTRIKDQARTARSPAIQRRMVRLPETPNTWAALPKEKRYTRDSGAFDVGS